MNVVGLRDIRYVGTTGRNHESQVCQPSRITTSCLSIRKCIWVSNIDVLFYFL